MTTPDQISRSGCSPATASTPARAAGGRGGVLYADDLAFVEAVERQDFAAATERFTASLASLMESLPQARASGRDHGDGGRRLLPPPRVGSSEGERAELAAEFREMRASARDCGAEDLLPRIDAAEREAMVRFDQLTV